MSTHFSLDLFIACEAGGLICGPKSWELLKFAHSDAILDARVEERLEGEKQRRVVCVCVGGGGGAGERRGGKEE